MVRCGLGMLYTASLSLCNRSCVEARDPYCAYDVSTKSCVTLLGKTGDPSGKLQDVVNGDSAGCGGKEGIWDREREREKRSANGDILIYLSCLSLFDTPANGHTAPVPTTTDGTSTSANPPDLSFILPSPYPSTSPVESAVSIPTQRGETTSSLPARPGRLSATLGNLSAIACYIIPCKKLPCCAIHARWELLRCM